MADTFERLKAALADRYAIERELGSGGMATVYLAEDLKHPPKLQSSPPPSTITYRPVTQQVAWPCALQCGSIPGIEERTGP